MLRPALPLLLAALCRAQSGDEVRIELMTFPEIYSAIHEHGKTTVLIYNGGTEQRGPHAVLGGHTLMAQKTGEAIARKLGNALLAPVLPFSPAGSHLNPKTPGSVAISPELFVTINEAVAHSMVVNGFKNIVLIGDHGGGQKELEQLAHKLNAKYSAGGVRVHYCGAMHNQAMADFNAWLKKNNLPVSTHAGIPDTSELMYLGGDSWIRKNKIGPQAPGNGIQGDPRPSTPEIGKRLFDMKVDYAVTDIRNFVAQR